MRKRTLTAAAASGLFVALAASPAHAADYYRYCSTTGASGSIVVDVEYNGNAGYPDYYVTAESAVTDTSADGHHARVRMVIGLSNGTNVYSDWIKATGGSGTSAYGTLEEGVNGTFENVAVQVARYEGSTYLNSCVTWS
ncbi:hypothetical protein [Streptomyces sp. RFCAC02]|uniref:hypothetical protein n=1 Tax=Streptomyces sp. RFCAC02 TaxID=2499143 RepID=UPI0010221EE4|nr:hypothetical protein [Streptomyces sp. RFCAC02]